MKIKKSQKPRNHLSGLLIVFAILFSISTFAQDVPPPPPSGGHGQTGNQEGRAPIGGGLFILLGLGAAYGGKKTYQFYQKKKKSLLD